MPKWLVVISIVRFSLSINILTKYNHNQYHVDAGHFQNLSNICGIWSGEIPGPSSDMLIWSLIWTCTVLPNLLAFDSRLVHIIRQISEWACTMSCGTISVVITTPYAAYAYWIQSCMICTISHSQCTALCSRLVTSISVSNKLLSHEMIFFDFWIHIS